MFAKFSNLVKKIYFNLNLSLLKKVGSLESYFIKHKKLVKKNKLLFLLSFGIKLSLYKFLKKL